MCGDLKRKKHRLGVVLYVSGKGGLKRLKLPTAFTFSFDAESDYRLRPRYHYYFPRKICSISNEYGAKIKPIHTTLMQSFKSAQRNSSEEPLRAN